MKLSKFLLVAGLALITAGSAIADQNFRPQPNGSVAFRVSTGSTTRVRFVNDRIAEIITDSTAFETRNDENSGDLYFRAIEGAETSVERGYFITEKGVTVRFQMTPVSRPVEDVVIAVRGAPQPQENAAGAAASRQVSRSRVIAGGNGYKNGLINTVRSVVQEHLRRRPTRSGRIRTLNVNGFTVEIHAVSGGREGRSINEASFARPGVLAVWAETPTIDPGLRAWLVIVKQ